MLTACRTTQSSLFLRNDVTGNDKCKNEYRNKNKDGGQDLDLDDLGGLVRWTPAPGVAGVEDYGLFLALDAAGTGRSQVGGAISFGAGDQGLIPDGTLRSNFTTFTVPPQVLRIVRPLETNLSFTDEDLDLGDVGSAATWLLPEALNEAE
ncbi:hypothetical protein AK812_SmicGene3296 [Symbiodinium microadriaticum]|uniref:Uncharacterized protein n=1 Tax=Symbiodinium microadriaticum TaxID=2951 RepID=A0A1Q9EZ19_SYMMI|nr:hypothetical protein AK812_SmicGene3296 [Symbiodinium microadriaticum]